MKLKVIQVSQQSDTISLTLVEEQGRVKVEPVHQDDIEKMIGGVAQAFSRMGIVPQGQIQPTTQANRLLMTEEEYEGIGRPTVGDTVVLTIKKVKEGR